MSNAPERIVLHPCAVYGWDHPDRVKYPLDSGAEYVRADLFDALAQDASRAAELEKAAGEMADALINAIAGGLEREIYRAANAALATYRETQK